MTPMTQLKNNLDYFKLLIGTDFEEINLNKSAPKSFTPNWCGEYGDTIEHKGVQSDFLKIFKVQFNAEDTYSIAFRFNYIDVAEPSIEVSIKVGGEKYFIVASEPMNVSAFKDKLNCVNKMLQTEDSIAYDEVIDIVILEFIPSYKEKIDYAQKVNSGKKRIRQIK